MPLLRNWSAAALLLPVCLSAATDGPVCAGPALRPAATTALAARGQVRALVIFARFLDESGPAAVPAFADSLFDADLPGSLTHFFDEMSSGQFRLTGQVLPRIYVSAGPAERYLSNSSAGRGGFGQFTREILAAADADVDFAEFDNDGPDGLADSGDDDGIVDLVLLLTQSTPSGFISGDADGVALLGLSETYLTDDAARTGARVRVRGDGAATPGGALQRGRNLRDAAGIIAHEMGHLLGLPDLYDKVRTRGGQVEPADDSAGIGFWGLMGHGARGWDDRGGPTPFSAWSRMRLGWIGVGNDRLVTVTSTIGDAFFGDVHGGGSVYRLPMADGEELLVEYRDPGGSWYDRHLPAQGLLVWHVDPDRETNDDERAKLVDLVCADGLYVDAGFPLGTEADAFRGQDNLDFYAADADYRVAHGGNLGDATDLFTEGHPGYTPLTNPGINRLSISDIRRVGSGFSADLIVDDRRRAGLLTGHDSWRDTIDVVGDLTVDAGATVEVAPRTVVRLHADGLHTGVDPERVEISVQGTFLTSGAGAVLQSAAAAPAAGDWVGLATTTTARLSMGATRLLHARDAITVRGGNRGLLLSGVTVAQAAGDGIRLLGVEGDVRLLGVTVEGVGGDGISIDGGDPVRADGLLVQGNRGHGLVRADGELQLSGSVLADNGGTDLWLREGTFGQVRGNRLSGSGEGTRLDLTRALVFEENEWSGYDVALRTRSAGPEIRANLFSDVDTVLSAQGFRVPTVMQLNVVSQPRVLVVNETELQLDAGRNFWGTTEVPAIVAGMAGPVDWDPALNTDPRLPVTFELRPTYPNPFNGSTTIDFSVSQLDAAVNADLPLQIDILSVTGARVRRLYEQSAAPGVYRIVWDGTDGSGYDVASGVYVVQLSIGPIRLLRRTTVLR